MPTVQEVQEERHTLWLCTDVFESPYTANCTWIFPFDRIPTHYKYIYIIYIYIYKNYSYYRHVTY